MENKPPIYKLVLVAVVYLTSLWFFSQLNRASAIRTDYLLIGIIALGYFYSKLSKFDSRAVVLGLFSQLLSFKLFDHLFTKVDELLENNEDCPQADCAGPEVLLLVIPIYLALIVGSFILAKWLMNYTHKRLRSEI